MNRRKLFSFLAASPVGVIGAIAQAKQPTELTIDRLNIGNVKITSIEKGLSFDQIEKNGKLPFGSNPPDNTSITFTWNR